MRMQVQRMKGHIARRMLMNYYSYGGYQGRKSGAGRGGCGCGCNGAVNAPPDYPTSYSPMYQLPYQTNMQSPYQAYRSDIQTTQHSTLQMPNMNQIATMPLPSKQSTPSPELLKLLEQAVSGETGDRIFYKQLIDLAPTAADKEVIASIRDDELSHFKQFRQIYYDLTGKEISPSVEPTTEEQPQSYMAGLRQALFGEMAAVKRYRVIRSLLTSKTHRDMLFNIITDELTHMGKYNYLITINKRNP